MDLSLGLALGAGADRILAGPIQIRLPSTQYTRWSPSVADRIIGTTTTLSIDGVSRRVRVDKASVDVDAQFLLLTLSAVD